MASPPGEVAAHFADVYGASVGKDTISRITEKVTAEMAEWQHRPLDRVYPVILIDAIVVKVRDGQVTNKPIYMVIGVTTAGERDILGIWAGDGGEGAKFWLNVLTEIKNRGVEDVLVAVCDGLRGPPDAITTSWDYTQVQTCVIHLDPQHLPLCMSEFTPLREAVDTLASRRPSPDFGELQRRATRRGRRRVVMVAAATAVVIAGSVLAIAERDHDRRTAPVEQPKVVVGAVPVWYDAKGLHRGDVVEQTPVPPMTPAQVADLSTSDEFQLTPGNGVLALLRSGALYLDPATGDVWFHPWGGDPRIVGHNSIWGPGGDPNGDTAAWFEGPYAQDGGPGELVVYDTATGRVISRTQESHAAESGCCEHRAPENSFLDVSAKRVVWDSGPKTYSHHVRTRTTRVVHLSELKLPGGPEQYPNLEAFGTPAPAATTS